MLPRRPKTWPTWAKAQCTLKRAGSGLTSFPVLLNDRRVSLPAVHAQCTTDDGLNDFYFLDDLDNPLALAWKLTGSDTLQVVKISYPPPPAASPAAASPSALPVRALGPAPVRVREEAAASTSSRS